MVNYNGTLSESSQLLSINNRGFAYGDAVFETIKVVQGTTMFWEDHYFRLMASMRILRMEIPMEFTMEFLENEILKTIQANGLQEQTVRVRLNVFRDSDGLYTPTTNNVAYTIAIKALEQKTYGGTTQPYRVDIFKDFPITTGLLSTLKTNNRVLNVVGSIYAQENDLQNCILLNTNKQVVEALNGNLFLVEGNTLKTPPILDGCIKGIMRKQVIEIIKGMEDLTVQETSISPFEMQQADELFISNAIIGIQSITHYRKKIYYKDIASRILEALNGKLPA